MSAPLPYTEASGNNSLYIVNFGEEKCQPFHFYGPAQRTHYLIHFVVSGKGTFRYPGQTQVIEAGQGFLILPGEETFYQADGLDPWHYAWVGYSGALADSITRAAGLSAATRVFHARRSPQSSSQPAGCRRQSAAFSGANRPFTGSRRPLAQPRILRKSDLVSGRTLRPRRVHSGNGGLCRIKPFPSLSADVRGMRLLPQGNAASHSHASCRKHAAQHQHAA